MARQYWIVAAVGLLATGAHAISPADKCQAGKLKIAGKYGLCRLKAEAKAVKSGNPVDAMRCNVNFGAKWPAAESAALGACPTNGDQAEVQSQLIADADFLALKLTGIRFVDNGDGTVTDSQTGLMWEKKDDGLGLHDKDNAYTWTDALTVFIPAVNGISADGTGQAGLAGYSDWRLPTNLELRTILLTPFPCATNPCIDPTFGPTVAAAASLHWSGTRSTAHPTFSWGVQFDDGLVADDDWSKTYYVRAVRSVL